MQCPKCLQNEIDLINRRKLRMGLGSRANRRQGVKSSGRTPPKKKLEKKVKERMEDHIENCDGNREND